MDCVWMTTTDHGGAGRQRLDGRLAGRCGWHNVVVSPVDVDWEIDGKPRAQIELSSSISVNERASHLAASSVRDVERCYGSVNLVPGSAPLLSTQSTPLTVLLSRTRAVRQQIASGAQHPTLRCG